MPGAFGDGEHEMLKEELARTQFMLMQVPLVSHLRSLGSAVREVLSLPHHCCAFARLAVRLACARGAVALAEFARS